MKPAAPKFTVKAETGGARPRDIQPGGSRPRVSRRTIQWLTVILANLYFLPFLRFLPFPFMHCYACPAAIGACPLGSLQYFIILGQFPFYLVGALGAVAALWGRTVCGYLCPFGLVQDLLYRLPTPKVHVSNRLAWTRWLTLIGLVGIATYILGEPWFCKVCPVGMLTAGLPVVAARPDLWSMVGFFYVLKAAVLVAVLAAIVFVKRPFCRFACPLGLLFGLLNRIGGRAYHLDLDHCTNCGSCRKLCPVDLRPEEAAGSSLCIKCGECLKCPTGAIK